jgi:hypothetical protein
MLVPSEFADLTEHGLTPRFHTRIPDTPIFSEWTFLPRRPHHNAVAILLKNETIACFDTQQIAYLTRYGYLPFAGYFRLFAHFG